MEKVVLSNCCCVGFVSTEVLVLEKGHTGVAPCQKLQKVSPMSKSNPPLSEAETISTTAITYAEGKNLDEERGGGRCTRDGVVFITALLCFSW